MNEINIKFYTENRASFSTYRRVEERGKRALLLTALGIAATLSLVLLPIGVAILYKQIANYAAWKNRFMFYQAAAFGNKEVLEDLKSIMTSVEKERAAQIIRLSMENQEDVYQKRQLRESLYSLQETNDVTVNDDDIMNAIDQNFNVDFYLSQANESRLEFAKQILQKDENLALKLMDYLDQGAQKELIEFSLKERKTLIPSLYIDKISHSSMLAFIDDATDSAIVELPRTLEAHENKLIALYCNENPLHRKEILQAAVESANYDAFQAAMAPYMIHGTYTIENEENKQMDVALFSLVFVLSRDKRLTESMNAGLQAEMNFKLMIDDLLKLMRDKRLVPDQDEILALSQFLKEDHLYKIDLDEQKFQKVAAQYPLMIALIQQIPLVKNAQEVDHMLLNWFHQGVNFMSNVADAILNEVEPDEEDEVEEATNLLVQREIEERAAHEPIQMAPVSMSMEDEIKTAPVSMERPVEEESVQTVEKEDANTFTDEQNRAFIEMMQ